MSKYELLVWPRDEGQLNSPAMIGFRGIAAPMHGLSDHLRRVITWRGSFVLEVSGNALHVLELGPVGRQEFATSSAAAAR